jgi:hypothetical protein
MGIELGDVLDPVEYEKVREERRRHVMQIKRARRVGVGRYLSLVFENRDTVLFQIQENCRAGRIADEARIQAEIDASAARVPGPGELSATLMIEVEDKREVQPVLDRFTGIDTGQHLWVQVGRNLAVPGEFERGHSGGLGGKLAAVHFVRFAFTPPAIRGFREAPVSLVVEHPAERARTELSEATRAALLEDLTG